MTDTEQKTARGDAEKVGRRSAGWHVLTLAWILFAAAFFAFSKIAVKDAPDIANGELLDIAHRYAAFAGAAFGFASLLATGIFYLVIRLIRRKPSRQVALILTALGYAPWLAFGWDLAYREPRYAEVARAIITYFGKPMLYSGALVCGVALAGAALGLVFSKRAK